MEAGRNAIRRLKAIEDARVTRKPFLNPLRTNAITWLIGSPSKPGRTSLFNHSLMMMADSFDDFMYQTALRLMSRLLI